MIPFTNDIVNAICIKEGLTLITQIGKGSFKTVFSVHTPELQKYALKIFHNPIINIRTEREIETIQKCDHKNIAKLIKVNNIQLGDFSYTYLIEELFEGGCLSARIGNMSYEDILIVGRDLVITLMYLKEMGIVHRDIKPDNIMFQNNCSNPILVDFGIARVLDATSITQSWGLMGPGTPYFSAPEQLVNKKNMIDWRTDQFSLGVVISIAAFGLHPYQYENKEEIGNIVQRVSEYKERSQTMLELYKNKFPCLVKMTSLWPIERYREPSKLLVDWNKQGAII